MTTRPKATGTTASRGTSSGALAPLEAAGGASAVGHPTAAPSRVVVESVTPQVDGGRFLAKRIAGEAVAVEADIFADGHDVLCAVLKWRRARDAEWTESPMEPLGNDRWRGSFVPGEAGEHRFLAEGWVDAFETWRRGTERKSQAGQDVRVDMLAGAELLRAGASRARPEDAARLLALAALVGGGGGSASGVVGVHLATVAGMKGGADAEATGPTGATALQVALGAEARDLMARYPDRRLAAASTPLGLWVDRPKARFSAWYELFPRSASPVPGRHGTFQDCVALLPEVARMGFDVLYLPPIHPIGRLHRKGRNNAPAAREGEPGSPWAIGAAEGGHKAIHPELGTPEEFRELVAAARDRGIELALDIAFQCAPDHPYVREHPEWFSRRPDGSIQYAENPPKKYQDIFPFNFETEAHEALFVELRSILEHWIDEGVRIFRVDNPHTKPFWLWERLIGEIHERWPDVLFLAEAFTRPRVMHRLAKAGFTQSYTYFTWRNTKRELTEYFTELTRSSSREYFRPNLWPNTPDILTEQLQFGGRPVFLARATLSATLGASFGIYGPAFELCESEPREPGSEEYRDSEKYEIRTWDRGRPDRLNDFLATLNKIRRETPALQDDWGLRFHEVDNDQLIAYSKTSSDESSSVLVVVNLDSRHVQSGWLQLPLEEFGLDPETSFQAHDLLQGARYLWQGPSNYVELDPRICPAHIFRLRRRVRREQDFEYFF